tara:strand:+ start:4163 stop:5038 length:876 start_codon:yes stop_codon:yes gene_type:complete
MNVGIIGQGFVGSAINNTLSRYHDVKTYDIDSTRCNSSLESLMSHSDIVFVCVPTPMRKNGSCDTRILESAINSAYNEIKKQNPNPKHSDFLNYQKTKKVFVIKSTIPPGTTEKLSLAYPRINLCFSPEFLTEANAWDDFKNQNRIIVGGEGAKKVKQMFRKAFPKIPIIITKSQTAEMVKYFTNCFLATKVTFANQMYNICDAADVDYDKVCEYALYDNRIGKSHLAVPGPDGDMGFGGHCFPKDLAAMINFSYQENVDNTFLDCVDRYNARIRTNKDWYEMKGRAVSDD